ncbi:MAG: adenine phosphoribosyltransferase [Thermoprotei archaeon]|nr:MAG: adenine phosphoribosyltransferase [Thermoprotei archaeon]RLF22868.1 MAG: adenine phosphoribosyltransferase [Thermoprotei archaeon]
MMLSKYDELKFRLRAIEVLRTLKEVYSYEELSGDLRLSPQALSRYVSGKVIPSLDRCREILELMSKRLGNIILEYINVRENVVDVTSLLSNPRLLRAVAKVAATYFIDKGVTKVLTKEVNGIPIATLIADEIGALLVVARERKEVGVDKFIEVKHVYPSGTYTYIYVPKYLLKKGDRVLIADDLIRSGSTVRALANVCRLAECEIIGVFAIIGKHDGIRALESELKVPVIVIVKLS